ncbi:MAG TPA: hypothetical protein VLT33_16165 [Labilithrix sp.]|nr:hypothetical protein [Labilithrix sp.]
MKRGAWGWLLGLAAFVAYAVWLAPPDDPAFTRALVRGSLTGDFGAVDPAIAAVFTALGVVPVLASTFVLRDGARRKLPAWPFALAMFVVGAFALLPWLALRHLGGPRAEARPPGAVRRLLARRGVGVGIVVALVGLAGWGLVAGSAAAYGRAFRTVSMVHVMTVDLVVCAALLLVLAEEARAGERGAAAHQESALARRLRFVPLLGTALWNALTPRAP